MLYHHTAANQIKINELKIILCYKCELMRPRRGIINLAISELCLAIHLRKLNLLKMQKVQCKCIHAQEPCKKFTHLICTAVFSTSFFYHVITA